MENDNQSLTGCKAALLLNVDRVKTQNPAFRCGIFCSPALRWCCKKSVRTRLRFAVGQNCGRLKGMPGGKLLDLSGLQRYNKTQMNVVGACS